MSSHRSLEFLNTEDILCGIGESDIRESEIVITEYPFEPSIAYPTVVVAASDIVCLSVEIGMCKVHVKNDIILVSAEHKETLKQFALRNHIRLIPQSWNWDWLLEPYLDTEFTKANERQVLEQLLENGFTANEVDTIREEVKDQMYVYNFDTMLWDWCSLSLADVLAAMRVKYSKEQFHDFYKRALEIEKRTGNSTTSNGV
ncbi:hypothetical protein [Maribacter ulvicola]|uniref:hypothetical protein n=1 Tax=Maribacter ulvicola TaxID=228959 RepID=UPI00117DAC12|nr:hypothetical protein [Maribacter ulvicola]